MTTSDLGQIWNTALARYKEAAGFEKGFDISKLSSATSIADVVSISDDSLKKFENWRHDGGRFDKFRTFIADHLEPIEKVAEYVADAASGAFPPSTAIFKVVQYLLQVATEMRADFDKVEKFFDKLGSYLKSLKILEHHVPAIPELREALMNVMSCLLVICGTSTRYIKKERWSKGLKKLFYFDDDDLDNAYADLEKKLAEENRAVQLAQLRIGQEIKDDVGEGRKEQREVHAAVDRGVQLGMQNLQLLQGLQERLEDQHKQSEVDDIDYIKEAWKSFIFETDTYESIQRNFLEETGKWVLDEPAYQSWAKGEIQVLWLSGLPGSGKSYLTNSIIQNLQQEDSPTPKGVTAAVVYFDNRPEKARSLKVALCTLVVKLAEADPLYRKRVTAQIKGTSVSINDAGIETVWTRYVLEPLRQPSRSIVYMIMDGLEKTNADEWRSLLRLALDIPKYQLPIRMLLSGRPELDVPVASICDPHQAMIHVTEDKNRKDLERFVQYQYDQTIQLKRQKPEVRKKVTKSLLKNAKGMFLYVDLALKELDTISQERAILDALNRLPRGLAELYEMSLASILARSSSSDEIYFLKKLFTWVTFAERPLSLHQYNCLMSLDSICKDYSVEDEVKGRGASLLRLTGLGATQTKNADPEAAGPVSSRVSPMDQKTRQADSDDEWADEADDDEVDDDKDDDNQADDDSDEREEGVRLRSTFVQPVHNSLLDYLRDPSTTLTSVTRSTLDANAELFMLCKDVVCNEDDIESPEWSNKAELYDYAIPSLFGHLQNINRMAVPNELLVRVLKGLKDLFTKVVVVSGTLQTQNYEGYFGFKLPLTPEWSGRALVLDILTKAVSLNHSLLQQDCIDWMKTVLDKPSDLLLPLAKAHAAGWLCGAPVDSESAFECALAALSTTDLTRTLSKPISDDVSRTKEEIMFVASAFPDLTQDSDAHREIALMLSRSPRVAQEYAIEEINKSIALATTELERYLGLVGLAEIQKSNEEYSKAVDTVHSAIAILDAGSVYANEEIRAQRESRDKKLAYLTLAEALSGVEDVNGAVEAFHQAFELAKDDQTERFEILGDILEVLDDNKDYGGIMREIESVDTRLLSMWFSAPSHLIEDGHAVVHQAAKQSQREDALIRCYNATIEMHASTGIAWVIRYHLAIFYRRVLGDDDKAYEELQTSLEERPSDLEQEEYDEILNEGPLMLCEITFNRLRAAKDTASKKALKKELDSLLHAQDDEARDVRDEVMSLLLIKPHLELNLPNKAKKMLEGKLAVCKETLHNSIGDDDSDGFILLAKTLALAGMKHDAEIALSCIFSALRPEFLRPDEDSASDDPLQAAINSLRSKSPYGDEDLADVTVSCDGGDHFWECWDEPMYLCIDCVDVHLCEVCHGERMKRNSLAGDGGGSGLDANSPPLSWKIICGKNHEYIRGPVEGWTGIKDGVARIGEQRIKMEDWFKKVEVAFKKVKL